MVKERRIIHVSNRMQTNYAYELEEEEGANFCPLFTPFYAPQQMLEMGVFEGKYMNDACAEYPVHWFKDAKLSDTPDPKLNYFEIKSRQPLSVWRQKGWIIGPDPRGWFEWYCRYYMGRRLPLVDELQIKRWRAFSRHAGQVRANCEPGDIWCRPKQRQALLQWSHDPFV